MHWMEVSGQLRAPGLSTTGGKCPTLPTGYEGGWTADTGGKKWECNRTGYQLFIEFEKAYDSVRRAVYLD
jgi:hypothetical protein